MLKLNVEKTFIKKKPEQKIDLNHFMFGFEISIENFKV